MLQSAMSLFCLSLVKIRHGLSIFSRHPRKPSAVSKSNVLIQPTNQPTNQSINKRTNKQTNKPTPLRSDLLCSPHHTQVGATRSTSSPFGSSSPCMSRRNPQTTESALACPTAALMHAAATTTTSRSICLTQAPKLIPRLLRQQSTGGKCSHTGVSQGREGPVAALEAIVCITRRGARRVGESSRADHVTSRHVTSHHGAVGESGVRRKVQS